MVRIRHSDSVVIQISGPRRIIPQTRVEIGRRSMTWKQFVMDVCKIQLDTKKEYFICTAGYSPNHSVEGWTACLNDPINLFVKNYTKKLRKYSVRLHRGPAPLKTNHPIIPSECEPKPKVEAVNHTSSMYVSPQKPIISLAAKKFASISPLKPSQLAELMYQQKVEQTILEEKEISNVTTSKRKRRARKNKAKISRSRSVKLTETKLVIKSKTEERPPKLIRYDEVEMQNKRVGLGIRARTGRKPKQFEANREGTMINNFSIKNEPIVIDIIDLDEDEQDFNFNEGEYVEENGSEENRFSEGEYQFERIVSTNQFENASEVINKEKGQSGPEMQDLLTRFEQSIDTFDESLLEQIKSEVISLKQNGMWERNMKRSPLACFLIEEICKA